MATRKKAKAIPHPEPEMFTIYADILQETEASEGHEGAILINCGEAEKIWLPISQIQYAGDRGDTDVPIEIPDWLAEENGLVDGQNDPDFREVSDASIDDAQESPAVPAGEAVAAVMESLDPPALPQTFSFTADVAAVYDEKYVLQVTNDQGGTASLEFNKDEVRYDGYPDVDLQEGYEHIKFTVPWGLAVEKHLPEFLGVTTVPPAEPAAADAEESVEAAQTEGSSAHPYRHKLRTETVCKEIELSDAEKIAYGKDLVEHLESEAEYKEIASSNSARARNERKSADKVIDILKAGREERNITCDVIADYNTGHLVYVESEWPHREIQRRPLTDKDRQLSLFGMQTSGHSAPLGEDPRSRVSSNASPEVEVSGEAQDTSDNVTLTGEITDTSDNDVYFLCPPDSGEKRELIIPLGDVIEIVSGEDDTPDSITILRSLAEELGITIEQPAVEDTTGVNASGDGSAASNTPESAQERSCGTCSHVHDVPDDDEPSPCTDCGQDPELPNWTDGYHAPVNGQEPQSAAMQ